MKLEDDIGVRPTGFVLYAKDGRSTVNTPSPGSTTSTEKIRLGATSSSSASSAM
jgi:hypothetical protein